MWPNQLKNNKTHVISSTAKNGGLAIIETKYLTKCGVEEHFSNTAVYKKLSRGATYGQLQGVERLMESFISRHRDHLPDHEYTYLKRGLKRDRGRIGRFYTMVKLHKTKKAQWQSEKTNHGEAMASKRIFHMKESLCRMVSFSG